MRIRVVALLLVAGALTACNDNVDWDTALPKEQARVFVVNNHSDAGHPFSISVIDPRDNRVVRTFTVGDNPHHIYVIPGTNKAYVTHFTGNQLDVVDLRANRVIGQVSGTGTGPRHLTLTPDGALAITNDFEGGTVTIIDTRRDAVVATIATGINPNYGSLSADNLLFYVANAGDDKVTVIDLPARQVRQQITVGQGPFDVELSPDGKTLVSGNRGANTASIIDALTNTVVGEVPLGGQINPGIEQKLNVRITHDGRYAWIGNQAAGAFSVVDIQARSLAAVHATDSGADILYQVHSGPQAGLGLTTARYGSSLSVVKPDDPATPPRNLPTGQGSHNLSRTPDETVAYVSDRIGNAVSVIDMRSLSQVALIPVGLFPDGISYVWWDQSIARDDHSGDPRKRPS